MTDKPMITRGLLEHYLRATGWNPSDRYWTNKDWNGHHIAVFDNAGIVGIGSAVSRIACAEGVPTANIGARLGMCAAAERLALDMQAYANDQECPKSVNDVAFDALMANYHDILTLAGIDPKAWESTRQ